MKEIFDKYGFVKIPNGFDLEGDYTIKNKCCTHIIGISEALPTKKFMYTMSYYVSLDGESESHRVLGGYHLSTPEELEHFILHLSIEGINQ